ncbi:MAG: toll/interleukin-1 receptor domain-containing protein, partial [Maribacter sp.]|nr:toll/interleukin-1 receptor domain-containing protein [Maribacter sp.]
YSEQDRDSAEALQRFIKPLIRNHKGLRIWDRHATMLAGMERSKHEIQNSKELSKADIIIFLLSAVFISDDHLWEDVKKAIKLFEENEARIVPILLRTCLWNYPPWNNFQILPSEKMPIADLDYWKDSEVAWNNVIENLGSIIAEIKESRNPT